MHIGILLLFIVYSWLNWWHCFVVAFLCGWKRFGSLKMLKTLTCVKWIIVVCFSTRKANLNWMEMHQWIFENVYTINQKQKNTFVNAHTTNDREREYDKSKYHHHHHHPPTPLQQPTIKVVQLHLGSYHKCLLKYRMLKCFTIMRTTCVSILFRIPLQKRGEKKHDWENNNNNNNNSQNSINKSNNIRNIIRMAAREWRAQQQRNAKKIQGT